VKSIQETSINLKKRLFGIGIHNKNQKEIEEKNVKIRNLLVIHLKKTREIILNKI